MEIIYSSKKLEKILTNERQIKKHYSTLYKKIIIRMSELKAANSLEEIPHTPPPRRHKLDGDREDCWGIDLSKNYRLIIRPVGDFKIEYLKTINSIEILKIEDFH